MDIIDALNWRYAVKKFDSTKKIPEAELEQLLEALRLSPSSYGLQPWKFIVISDQDTKEKLKPHSYNQSQVADCSHLVVLCRVNNIDEAYIEKYIKSIAETRGQEVEELDGYKGMMSGALLGHEKPCFLRNWANKQVYIALGNLLTSAALMNIDACPMEGFMPAEYDEILGLKEKGLSSVVVCPIGYRSPEDDYAKAKKVRFSTDEVIERL